MNTDNSTTSGTIILRIIVKNTRHLQHQVTNCTKQLNLVAALTDLLKVFAITSL